MATKFGTKSAITRLIYETSARSLCITGGFRGPAIEWWETNSTATNPCCHGNEIWDKIGYNSAHIRDIREIFVYNRGFSGSGYWITPEKFYRDQPPLPWQRNLRQNRLYVGLCTRYLGDLSVQQGFFGVGLLQGVRKILPRPTTVAMATKFETKSSITRLVYDISRRSLRLTRGFQGRANEWCHTNSTTTVPGCHGNEILDKIGYNSSCVGNITEMFAPSRGFSRACYWMTSDKFCHKNWPWLPWQRNLRQQNKQ